MRVLELWWQLLRLVACGRWNDDIIITSTDLPPDDGQEIVVHRLEPLARTEHFVLMHIAPEHTPALAAHIRADGGRPRTIRTDC